MVKIEKIKPIARDEYSYEYIKNNAGSYKSIASDSYFITNGQGSVIYIDDNHVFSNALDILWNDRYFIEVDCFIKFVEKG